MGEECCGKIRTRQDIGKPGFDEMSCKMLCDLPMKNSLKKMVICGGVICASSFTFGQTWIQTSAPTNKWYSVCSSVDGDKVVAVVNPGSIYVSTNSAEAWAMSSAPSNAWSSIASSANGQNLVAAGGGSVYTSSDSGISWSSNTIPWIPATTNQVFVASSTDGNKLLAVVQRTGFFTSTNAGGTWTSNNVSAKYFWIFAASSSDGIKLWAVNDSAPNIWVSTNSGTTWAPTTAFSSNWRAVAPTADGRRLAGVNFGWGIYISTNSGTSWSKTSAPNINGQNWQAVASSVDGVNLAATAGVLFSGSYHNGPIYTSTNSGTTWTSNNAPSKTWTSVCSSADGNKLVAVANDGGIYTSQTTPSPKLNIISSNNLSISWIVPSSDFVLQRNLDLSTTNWVVLTNTPTLNLTNLQNEISLPLNAENEFFRLISP